MMRLKYEDVRFQKERSAEMEPKTIIAIVLVAFIVGGFIFLQVRNRKKK